MNVHRFIALVDLDAFYASVEVLEDDNLRGKPLLIGGSPDKRGVVATASYEARARGCKSAMPVSQALRLCPEAILITPRFSLYKKYSDRVMAILKTESEAFQQVSIDETYIDLTSKGLTEEETINFTHRLKARIHVDIGLPCSVGMASNKIVAKVACEQAKPNGFKAVRVGQEATFLKDLDISALPGIGPQSTKRLNSYGFYKIGDIARSKPEMIAQILGSTARSLYKNAMGEDDSIVSGIKHIKSISSERTFPTDITFKDGTPIFSVLSKLTSQVWDSSAKKKLNARTISIKLRYSDFRTITRSKTLGYAIPDKETVEIIASDLINQTLNQFDTLRLMGLTLSNFYTSSEPSQLPFKQLLD